MLTRIANTFSKVLVSASFHLPGVFNYRNDLAWEFVDPNASQTFVLEPDTKTIITTGSVGQPRDCDPRAAFLTIDEDFVTFHRVEYDVNTTVHKIRANPELDNRFADRLLQGI